MNTQTINELKLLSEQVTRSYIDMEEKINSLHSTMRFLIFVAGVCAGALIIVIKQTV
jgi:hypothetical protein